AAAQGAGGGQAALCLLARHRRPLPGPQAGDGPVPGGPGRNGGQGRLRRLRPFRLEHQPLREDQMSQSTLESSARTGLVLLFIGDGAALLLAAVLAFILMGSSGGLAVFALIAVALLTLLLVAVAFTVGRRL